MLQRGLLQYVTSRDSHLVLPEISHGEICTGVESGRFEAICVTSDVHVGGAAVEEDKRPTNHPPTLYPRHWHLLPRELLTRLPETQR